MLRIAMSFCHTGPKSHSDTKPLNKFMLLCAIGQNIRICYQNMLKRLLSNISSGQVPNFLLMCSPNKTGMQRNNVSSKPFFSSCSWANGHALCAQKIQEGPRDRPREDLTWFPNNHKRYTQSLCAGLVRRNQQHREHSGKYKKTFYIGRWSDN